MLAHILAQKKISQFSKNFLPCEVYITQIIIYFNVFTKKNCMAIKFFVWQCKFFLQFEFFLKHIIYNYIWIFDYCNLGIWV